MPIEIPKHLKQNSFRFIKIAMNGNNARKRPLEPNWQDRNNYVFFDNRLKTWSERGNNYGVVCGYGNLAVIDADDDAISFIVENRLPKTFTVLTGSGGKHYYYIIPDLDKKIVLKDENDRHFGEIQFRGSQVIGPNSIHPNGNKYLIVKDEPIATISKQHIREILAKYIKTEQTNLVYDGDKNFQNIDISKCINTERLRYRNGEFVGSHPIHGSTTGGNFSVNIQKSMWHCFRCGTGGGPISLIAMLEGLVKCGDVKPGAITNEIYQKVIIVAKEKYGIVIEE